MTVAAPSLSLSGFLSRRNFSFFGRCSDSISGCSQNRAARALPAGVIESLPLNRFSIATSSMRARHSSLVAIHSVTAEQIRLKTKKMKLSPITTSSAGKFDMIKPSSGARLAG